MERTGKCSETVFGLQRNGTRSLDVRLFDSFLTGNHLQLDTLAIMSKWEFTLGW